MKVEKMWKTINNFRWDKGKIRYCIGTSEWRALVESGNIVDAVANAFDYGFIKGIRYQKAQQEKDGKVAKV